MPRVKRGFKALRRRNRIRKAAKGFRGGRSKLWKAMVDAVRHAWRHATKARRRRKRDFRSLWIVRINAATRLAGVSYSKFMSGLKRQNIALDRKILANLAITDPAAFQKLVEQSQRASA